MALKAYKNLDFLNSVDARPIRVADRGLREGMLLQMIRSERARRTERTQL